MDMPPLTPPDQPLPPLLWRVLLLLACVLVFSFALHAKVAVYGHSTQPQPGTSSKLWTNGMRFEAPPENPSLPLLWLTLFLVSIIWLTPSSRLQETRVVVARTRSSQQFLHRFLRPPPSYS